MAGSADTVRRMTLSSVSRAVVATALTAVVALPLAAVSTPAEAATRCTINDFSPRVVEIGLSPVVKSIKPKVSGCTLEGWDVAGESFYTYDGNAEWVFYPPYRNSAIPPEDVVVTAHNEDYDVTNKVFRDAFRIKRNTTWDKVNAAPEPVRKGSTITIKARLRIANWEQGRYDGFTKRTVSLQTRAAKGGPYTTVKTATTVSGGYVTTTVKASSDKCFRFNYGGNAYAGGGASKADCVDVK